MSQPSAAHLHEMPRCNGAPGPQNWVVLRCFGLSPNGCGPKIGTPKWKPGKWTHGLKPVVPCGVDFDPYPNGLEPDPRFEGVCFLFML